MAVNLKGRSFLTLQELSPAEIRYLLDLGHDLKAKRRSGIHAPTLRGKHIVLLFEKTSTRTRCSFEVAATQEGAHVTYLDAGSSQMGKKESLEDSAKVLGRFFDGIEYRGYEQRVVEDLARFSGVPVYNGLTDVDHPTQILADMMTIEEHCAKPLNKVKVVFPGDVRNNMCWAWMYGAAKMGMHFVGLGPEELARELPAQQLKAVFEEARKPAGIFPGTHYECHTEGQHYRQNQCQKNCQISVPQTLPHRTSHASSAIHLYTSLYSLSVFAVILPNKDCTIAVICDLKRITNPTRTTIIKITSTVPIPSSSLKNS